MALVVSATSKLYSGFSPTSIPGCALWLDAADASSLTLSGSNVTAWRDKSPNAYSATNLGTIAMTTQNGIPALNFGTNRMTIANYAWNTYSTVFIVARAITNGNFFFVQVINNNEYTNFVFTGNWTLWQGYTGGSKFTLEDNTVAQGSSVVGANQLFCFAFGYAGGTTAAHYTVNGSTRPTRTVTGSALSDGTTIQPLYINGRWDSTVYDNSIVCEILHYNGTLTTAQRQQVEGYLAWKWGGTTLVPFLPSVHPYRTIPVVMRPFLPVDVPGCQLWLDAADASSIVLSGSNVTQWRDKSGNGYNCSVTTGATSPVYASQTLQFRSASQQSLTIAQGFGDALANNTNYTIFFVGARRASGFHFFLAGTASGLRQILMLGFSSSTTVQYNLYGDDFQATVPAYFAPDPTYILSFSSATNFRNIVINGTVGNTSASDGRLTAFSTPMIGRRYANEATIFHDIDVNEVIAYTSSISTTQRQQIEGYLARKWGLRTNLPSTHPFRLALPAAPVFTPLQIPGCALWLDAADRTTLTLSGSNVTTWADKSGNNNNSTSASAVTYSANSVNGLSAITFGPGGLNNGSIIVGSISPSNTGTQVSAFIVATMKSESYIYTRFLSLGSSGGNDYQTVSNIQLFGRSELLNIGMAYNNAGIGSTIPAYDTPFQAFSSRDSSTLSFGVNGSTPATAASGTTGNFLINFYAIGASLTSQTGLSGKICEIIVYNSSLSSNQRQTVEGYLAAKWGLKSNLPATHGFKQITP